MTTVRPKILYERGVIRRIAKRFGVTERTVLNALRFVTEGEQPNLIRKVAIKEYGCVLSNKPVSLRALTEEE